MSDILIRGMEMPKHDDDYVIFTVYGDGGVVYGPLNRPHVRYKHRAIPLPEKHGRLIDAEAFVDYIQNRYDNNELTNGDWIDFRLSLKDQPTIVPAEGGG